MSALDIQEAYPTYVIELAEAEANAARLLAALKLAADWMGEWNRPASVMDTILAAISKAEGRS